MQTHKKRHENGFHGAHNIKHLLLIQLGGVYTSVLCRCAVVTRVLIIWKTKEKKILGLPLRDFSWCGDSVQFIFLYS